MAAGKTRRFQPNRNKLDKAISAILDKAVNADSENAPKQLRAILLTENPQWKLPERRVARYLKRHLKSRKDPMADEIEADMDEQTVYTINSSINYPAIRGEEEAPIKEVVQTREAYTDENDTEKKEPKPVLCDGFKCVIS